MVALEQLFERRAVTGLGAVDQREVGRGERLVDGWARIGRGARLVGGRARAGRAGRH
jgi:hypothetical protein